MNKFFDFLDKYYYNHKGLRFVLFLLFVVYYSTGCVTVADVPTYLETPGPVGEHFGSVSTTSVNGVETEKKTLEEETVLTPAMAEYKLKLAALKAQLEAAKRANRYNPSMSGGYYGGGVSIVGPGGYNRNYSNGGGTSSGSTGGATITTGSGGSSQVVNNPSGPNTSGANPPGGVTIIPPGGSNTNYHH